MCQSDWAAAFYLLWRHGAGSDEDHCSSVAAHPKKKMPSIPCKLFFRKVECFCISLVVSYGFCVILPPQEKFASYGPVTALLTIATTIDLISSCSKLTPTNRCTDQLSSTDVIEQEIQPTYPRNSSQRSPSSRARVSCFNSLFL